MNQIRVEIMKLVAPSVQIGMGKNRSGLALKFHAMVHALFLLAPDKESLEVLIKHCIPCWLSDQGTESGVAHIKPISLKRLFPWMRDGVELVKDVDFAAQPELDPTSGSEHAVEDDFAPPLDPAEPAQQHQEPQHNRPKKVGEIIIDTTSSFEIPGLLHMIHNAGKGLEVKLIHYADSIDRLGEVADLVSKKESKERFFQTCFLSPLGRYMWKPLSSFSEHCYVDRWGTVAACVLAMTEDVHAAMTWGWDLNTFVSGSGDFGELGRKDTRSSKHSLRLEVIESTIKDVFHWSYWQGMASLARVLNRCLIWAESCPCHYSLLHESDAVEIPPEVRAASLTCPLRKRRCAELATGDLFPLLGKLFEEEIAGLLTRLSAELTAAQRKDILKDVELGKQHVIAVCTLKLAHWMIPPHVVMGMAHYDDDKMWECYTKARDSGHDHPRIKRLLSDDLAADVAQFSEHRSFFCLFTPLCTDLLIHC